MKPLTTFITKKIESHEGHQRVYHKVQNVKNLQQIFNLKKLKSMEVIKWSTKPTKCDKKFVSEKNPNP